MTLTLFELISSKVTALIPSDRAVLLVSEHGNLRLIQLDGKDYIDPRTGQPFRVPLSDLIDDRVNSDPHFRNIALSIAISSTNLVRLLSKENPLFILARSEVERFADTANSLGASLDQATPIKPVLYIVSDAVNGSLIARAETTPEGDFTFFGPPDRPLRIQCFDASSRGQGELTVMSPESGRRFEVRALASASSRSASARSLAAASAVVGPTRGIIVLQDASHDTDGDGLGDLSEQVLGTNPNDPDTDHDGLSDLAEIQQGLDPLGGRAFPTGVIASLPLPGEAKEVVIEGSTLNAEQQTAYLALGARGLG